MIFISLHARIAEAKRALLFGAKQPRKQIFNNITMIRYDPANLVLELVDTDKNTVTVKGVEGVDLEEYVECCVHVSSYRQKGKHKPRSYVIIVVDEIEPLRVLVEDSKAKAVTERTCEEYPEYHKEICMA